MQKYAISHVTFQRGAGRRLQRVQNASAYVACRVVIKSAVDEAGGSADVGPAAEICRVAMKRAVGEVSMSTVINVGPAALHAKVCNQS